MSHRLLPIIDEAMLNAADNGYAADLEQLTDEQLASDLFDCCGALDQEPWDEVLAAVREFRAARPRNTEAAHPRRESGPERPIRRATIMATKSNTDAAPPENLPAVQGVAGLPAGMDEDWGHYGGAGTSERSDDSVIPFLKLLQDMSPEGQSRHEKYVDGAMVGALLNTATKRLWLPEHRDKDGQHPEEPCIVLPVMFQREICAWRPRDAGGGLTGKYPITKSTVEETMKFLGGKYVKDPRDTKGQKMKWVLGEDDLIDTRYQFAVTLDGPELDEVSPVVMSFSSTGHQAARAWMALQRQPMPGRGVPPAWFRTYIAHRATRQNSQGNWFVLDMQLQGYTQSKDVREYCRQMYDSIQSGAVRAAEEDTEVAPGVQAAQDSAEDVPF